MDTPPLGTIHIFPAPQRNFQIAGCTLFAEHGKNQFINLNKQTCTDQFWLREFKHFLPVFWPVVKIGSMPNIRRNIQRPADESRDYVVCFIFWIYLFNIYF